MSDLPLIPRRTLFRDPDRTLVMLSPDGNWIAFLAPHNGVLNLWVAPRSAPTAARPLTAFDDRGLVHYGWAKTSRALFYLRDRAGDENWHLYLIDRETAESRDLTPFDGVSARPVALSAAHPDAALIAVNNRDERLHDLYRVDLATGALTLVAESQGFLDWLVDNDLTLRGASRMTPAGDLELLRPTESGWQVWEQIPAEDTMTTDVVGFAAGGHVLFMRDSRGRDTGALVARDLTTGATTLLAENALVDAGDVLRHPTAYHVQAVAFTYTRKEWRVLDAAIAADLEALRAVADGELLVTSRSDDDAWWTAAFVVDNGPVRYYLYERAQRQATFLFTNNTALEGLPLARMEPVVIAARDGQPLVGYLTRPLGADGRPTPLVLLPHGGPWGRDYWGYDPSHQWLANRGYAALSINFRSSTGFGKAFVNAGDRQWAGTVLNDQIDAVRWAIAQGVADPARVAVMGGSFGGYSALAGLAFEPELYACAVDIVGPSNLFTLLESVPPYWRPMFEMLAQRVGDPRTEEGRALLHAHSPLTHVGRIVRPLLIGQGANDPRVKQAESDQIAAALRARGIPVAYALYPDEGHGFARQENRFSFYATAEAFLGEHLGGRVEPLGADLEGSSLQRV